MPEYDPFSAEPEAPAPVVALAKLPEFSGIELAIAQPIIDAFLPHFNAALALAEQAKSINVTDPTDVDGIKASREARLAIRKPRLEAEKVHAREKNVYLRMGRAIDGIRNRIKDICEPVEKRLQDQEDIAARIAAERKRKLGEERSAELSKHTGMVPPPPELGNWPQAQYDAYLSGVKAQKAKEKAEAEAAEAQRIAAEREHLAREASMKAENERLRVAAEQARKEQAEKDAAHAAADAIARKEREKREAVERELAAQKAAADAKAKAATEAARLIAAAPDKEKLKALAIEIGAVKFPELATKEAQQYASAAGTKLCELSAWLMRAAEKL